MRALTLTAVVRPDHTLTVQVPEDIPSGSHPVVIILDSPPSSPGMATSEWRLPVHDVGPWPEGFTLRRADIYGDDGR
jgi:hypothetical protein